MKGTSERPQHDRMRGRREAFPRTTPRSRSAVLFLGSVLACAAPLSCHRAAEGERRDVPLSVTEPRKITPIVHPPVERAARADDKPQSEQRESLFVVRREQDEYRARIRSEIDVIERRLSALNIEIKRDKEISIGTRTDESETIEIGELLSRRMLLRSHLDAMDRATSDAWPGLKARLDRDLRKDEEPAPTSPPPVGM